MPQFVALSESYTQDLKFFEEDFPKHFFPSFFNLGYKTVFNCIFVTFYYRENLLEISADNR